MSLYVLIPVSARRGSCTIAARLCSDHFHGLQRHRYWPPIHCEGLLPTGQHADSSLSDSLHGCTVSQASNYRARCKYTWKEANIREALQRGHAHNPGTEKHSGRKRRGRYYCRNTRDASLGRNLHKRTQLQLSASTAASGVH